MDFKRRLQGLQKSMDEFDIDLVVFGSCQNFQYLTGLLLEWRRMRDIIPREDNVFVPKEGPPILTLAEYSSLEDESCWIEDVRVLEKNDSYRELVKQIALDLGWRSGKIAIGENLKSATWFEINSIFKEAKFCNGKFLMDKIRMIKEPDEIRKLREVASLTDNTMESVIPMIRDGISMRELSLEIEFAGRKLGASDVSFPPVGGFIKSGSIPNGSIYSYKLDQGLKSKTTVFFDVGFVLDGYCSDWGRSIYYGNPDNEIKGGYYSLQQAVVETVDEMHEGSMKVSEVFNHIEASLDKEGYGDYLRARLPNRSVGHQIGVEVHEPPWLRPDFDDLLQEGMIMCLEPKLWRDGEYYFRVEDMILIHKNKAEFLTSFDRELFEI